LTPTKTRLMLLSRVCFCFACLLSLLRTIGPLFFLWFGTKRVPMFLSYLFVLLFGGWKDGNPTGVVWRGGVHIACSTAHVRNKSIVSVFPTRKNTRFWAPHQNTQPQPFRQQPRKSSKNRSPNYLITARDRRKIFGPITPPLWFLPARFSVLRT